MQFTAEHDQFRKTVRDVVEKEINPFADEWERTGIFPAHELFPKLGALGILGLEYDPAYGGAGADHSYTLVYGEEMGRAVGGVAMAATISPAIAGRRYCSFSSWLPKRASAGVAMSVCTLTAIATPPTARPISSPYTRVYEWSAPAPP